MNVLITCAGRRNYLVDFFKDAVHPYGGKVHVFNTDSDSAAYWQADVGVLSPFANDPQYATFVENYCITHDIHAVLSCMDVDLSILANIKEKFSRLGISVIIADPWVTDMALDKLKTHQFLVEHNLPVTPIYTDLHQALESVQLGKLLYPLYVKPRWGMGSIGLFKAENDQELVFYFDKTSHLISGSFDHYGMMKENEASVIIQGSCPGQEYGLDIINDLAGQHQVTVVKQKLAMRSGETDKAVTVKIGPLEKLGADIAAITRHPANMDVDVFWDGEKAYVLEFNPRFGGGYPFSHAAGIHLPKAIVAWWRNEIVDKAKLLTPKIGVRGMKGVNVIVSSETG